MTRRIIAIMTCLAAAAAGSAATAGAAGAAGAGSRQDRPRPLDILVTNDDGWQGEGGSQTPLIVALRDRLDAAGHHVTVVAPGTNQSGQGGRFSLPPTQLQVANPEPDVWTVTPGSPADSVFFAFDEIYGDDRPDLVVSGINPGNNMGAAVNHSGTVNAALTAGELGVPSVAVSLETSPDWPEGTRIATEHAAAYVVDLVAQLQGSGRGHGLMPQGVSLNVNYPFVAGGRDAATGAPTDVLEPRGTRVTSVDTGPFIALDYSPASGQGGAPGTYTVGFGAAANDGAPGTDVRAVQDDFVSISALDADRDLDASTTRWLRSVTRRLG
jgi:5'/3'-nucleotidase